MSLFQVVVGIGIIVVAYRGHQIGEIPAGSAGLRPYRPTRSANPVAFYLFLTLYIGAGLALLVSGILAILGIVDPLPLA